MEARLAVFPWITRVLAGWMNLLSSVPIFYEEERLGILGSDCWVYMARKATNDQES